jgi:hypothetical protein
LPLLQVLSMWRRERRLTPVIELPLGIWSWESWGNTWEYLSIEHIRTNIKNLSSMNLLLMSNLQLARD